MHISPATTLPHEERVRELAHTLWENEGRPDGRAEDHWLRAETLVETEVAPKPMKKPASKRSAKRTV